MSANARRLAEHVLARRTELDLSQLDVWQSGGPSNTTLTDIENARVENLTRVTARKLDAGLQWEPGSARRVWDGGDPTPLIAGDLADEVRASNLSDATKEHILRVIAGGADDMSAARDKVTGTDLTGLPSVAQKRRRTKARDDE